MSFYVRSIRFYASCLENLLLSAHFRRRRPRTGGNRRGHRSHQ